ncbi:MAG TPA: DUF885 domain-containing protein [Vicinamibacterales bacterium]|nr:DUF885 domain-containing protein [Vicinamibacterales bacterium]
MTIRAVWLGSAVAMVAMTMLGCAGGGGNTAPKGPLPGSGDAAFKQIATEILEDLFKRHPTQATDLGIHKYDAQLDDYSAAAVKAESDAARAFKTRLQAVDPASLSLDQQLDREQLLRAADNTVLQNDVIRHWAKDPDLYPTGITNTAYVMIKRGFAPADVRLKALIAREQGMPGVLAEARKNLDNPPKIFTEIALEQIDNNVSFFTNDVPAAFKDVTDKALLADFKKSNDAVIAALKSYKTYLQKEILPKSNGDFALGADTYAKALAAQEMVELPLDRLMQIAESDRVKNEDAFQATAKEIDAAKPADVALGALQLDHPAASALLKTTQDTLDSLRQFIVDHHIITIPPSDPARVKETPPFMRSTTTASMDTPGPFETAKLDGFYNMTLPDPRMPKAAQDDYMRGWYYASIVNVSVHEVYPGHYVQFLYAKSFPTDVRKVFGAATNSEGWAHYCEQMMLDEGFHAGEPKYRLAQLQDALLRNVRFIVGIKMHTQGMTVEEATKLFETQGHQPHQVAIEEAKRGAGDPLYGYYTMGKLMLLKLRDDYKAKQGAAYTLQGFHDTFIKLGPLPMPLIRRAMLGETGQLF